jgi:hypothetical protein
MTKLSPAAQAVVNAAVEAGGGYGKATPVLHARLAAALETAADQVVPYLEEPNWGACDKMLCDIELYTDHMRKRSELLAIAAELRGDTAPTNQKD